MRPATNRGFSQSIAPARQGGHRRGRKHEGSFRRSYGLNTKQGFLPRPGERVVPDVKRIPRHPCLSYDKSGSMSQKSGIPSEAIKKFRESKGLSQQQFASMLNVGVASLSRWENGAKKPTGTAAAVLAVLIGGSGVAGLTGLGLTGSGYAIYRLLKDRFEGEQQAGRR